MTTTEHQQQQKKVPKLEVVHDSQLKQVMTAVASACIERLGSESPASEFAQNRFLLEDLKDMLVTKIDHLLVICENKRITHTYVISTNSWNRGPSMSHRRWCSAVSRVRDRDCDKVLFIGGHTEDLPSSKRVTSLIIPTVTSEIDLTATGLEMMPNMRQERIYPGVGVIGDKIYVFGGRYGTTFFKTVEVFSMKDGKWIDDPRATPDMPTARAAMGVAVIGKKIYAIGGHDDFASFQTVEVLDTETNEWLKLQQMKTARYGMGVAVIDDRCIWVLGGYWDGNEPFESIEIFDVAKNEWHTSQIKLTRKTYKIRTVAVGHKIYVFSAGSFKVLDVDKSEWTTLALPEPSLSSFPHCVDHVVGY